MHFPRNTTIPVIIFSASALLTLTYVFYLTYSDYSIRKEYLNSTRDQIKTQELRGKILYLDEILTSSAKMAVASTDMRWKQKYDDHVDALEKHLEEAKQYTLPQLKNFDINTTQVANNILIKLETDAFDALQKNNVYEARQYLFGEEYQLQKTAYSDGVLRFSTSRNVQVRLAQLSATISYLDEVLTMSAKLAAATGDPSWELRYRKSAIILDNAINEAIQLSTDSKLLSSITKTQNANNNLIELEERAFSLSRQEKLAAASEILESPVYAKHKEIYNKGMADFLDNLSDYLTAIETHQEHKLNRLLLFSGACSLFLLISWILVIVYINKSQRAA